MGSGMMGAGCGGFMGGSVLTFILAVLVFSIIFWGIKNWFENRNHKKRR